MYANKKICLLLVEFLMTVVCRAEHNHIDEKSSDARYCSSNYKADDENSCKKELPECGGISDEIFSRRIVNMLLSGIDFKEGDPWFNARVQLEGTASELEALKNFGLGILTLQEVAPILDDVIKTTEFDGVYECGLCVQSLGLSLSNFIDTYLYMYKEYILSVILGIYLYRTIRVKKLSFGQIVILSFMCTFAIMFADIFPDTMREVEQEVKLKEAPIHCRPDEMSWADKIMALFASAKDCERYEEEINDRPETLFKRAYFRTIDRICGQVMAHSINIVLIITTLLAEILLGLCRLIFNLLKECSMTTFLTLTLVLYGFYMYKSTLMRRWEPRRSFNNAIFEEAIPRRTRNQRRYREYETLW